MSAKITDIRKADENHRVITAEGGGGYRRSPCSDCPWRLDATGIFPAEAFRLAANTAYDMATHTFGCHQSGPVKPQTCAGFLLRNSTHNLGVRLRLIRGEGFGDVHDGGNELHEDYRAMAMANGVASDDPALSRCRS